MYVGLSGIINKLVDPCRNGTKPAKGKEIRIQSSNVNVKTNTAVQSHGFYNMHNRLNVEQKQDDYVGTTQFITQHYY